MPDKPIKTKDGKSDKIFKRAKRRLKEVGKLSADTPAPTQASVQLEGGAQVVPHIVLHSTSSSKDESRKIAIVVGMPMYCSTGNNSGAANTWFPFVGQKPNDGYPGKGWIIKPEWVTHHLEEEMENNSQLKTAINTFMDNIRAKDKINLEQDFAKRWGSVSGLLMSAQVGGGIWETSAGKDLKQELKHQYQAFFDSMPAFQMSGEPDKVIEQKNGSDEYESTISEVNQYVGLHWTRECENDFDKMRNAFGTSAGALAMARTPQELVQAHKKTPHDTLSEDIVTQSIKQVDNLAHDLLRLKEAIQAADRVGNYVQVKYLPAKSGKPAEIRAYLDKDKVDMKKNGLNLLFAFQTAGLDFKQKYTKSPTGNYITVDPTQIAKIDLDKLTQELALVIPQSPLGSTRPTEPPVQAPQVMQREGWQPNPQQAENQGWQQPQFPQQAKQTGWDTPKTVRQVAGFSKEFPSQGQLHNQARNKPPSHPAPKPPAQINRDKAGQPAYRAPSPPAKDKKRKGSKPR